MNCPNCKTAFIEEKAGKKRCVTCGWFELVDKEWRSCEAPEVEQEPEPELQSESPPLRESPPPQEPSPAALEPDPAALEPDPAHPAETLEETQARVNPPGVHSVKKYLGGLLTVTREVDE